MPVDLPQIRILADKEIKETKEDMLDFKWLAETLKTIAITSELLLLPVKPQSQ